MKFKHSPENEIKNKTNEMYCFLLESTMLVTKEGTENTTETMGRTQAYSSNILLQRRLLFLLGQLFP